MRSNFIEHEHWSKFICNCELQHCTIMQEIYCDSISLRVDQRIGWSALFLPIVQVKAAQWVDSLSGWSIPLPNIASNLIPIAFLCIILCVCGFYCWPGQCPMPHRIFSNSIFARHRHFKWVSASGMYCKQGDSIGMHKYCKYCGTGTHFAGLHPDALGKAAQTMQGPRQEPDVWPDFAVGLLFLFWAHRKVWWPRTVK